MEESKYIGDLIKQTQNLTEFSAERLEEEQSIRDTLLDRDWETILEDPNTKP